MFLANYSDGLSDIPLPADDRLLPGERRPCACFVGVAPTGSFHLVETEEGGRVKSIRHVKDVGMRVNGGFFVFRHEIFDYTRTRRGARPGAVPAPGRREASWSPTPTTASGPAWTPSRRGSSWRTCTPAASRPGRSGGTDCAVARCPKTVGSSRGRKSMETLEELLEKDLTHVVRGLARRVRGHGRYEPAHHRRRRVSRLLPRPGRAVLERSVSPTSRPIHVTVVDNYRRGVPEWLLGLRGEPRPRAASSTTSRSRCPRACPTSSTSSMPRASPRRPTTASTRSRRWTPTSTACATCSTTRASRRRPRSPVKGLPLLLQQRDLRRPAARRTFRRPEDYRGNVSCTGPRACYDESKRYGETLCVNFARQYGVPVTMARPFNNYGPGLKITDRRVIPDFARDVLAGRDIVMLSDGVAEAHLLLRRRRGRRLLQGPGPRPARRALQHRRRDAGDLDARAGRAVVAARRASSSATAAGSSARRARRADYLVDNPNRRCPVITKARTELGYDPVDRPATTACAARCVWYSHNRTAAEA